MLKKLLSACILSGVFFGISYSMKEETSGAPASGGENPLALIVIGQRYADLDYQIRASIKRQGVLDFVKASIKTTADVCMLYHWCRNFYEMTNLGKVGLLDADIMSIQKWYIVLLMRVYIDVAACKVLKLDYEDVYELFKEKVRDVWYKEISRYNINFKQIIDEGFKFIEPMMGKLPPSIWICFCTRAYGSSVGIHPHTICFGNIDGRYSELYNTASIDAINSEKITAFKKIKAKLQEIAASEKSNQEKWAEFLTLAYKDI